jgi:SAM-dependent methyltransferase
VEPEEYQRIADLEARHWWYAGMRRAMLRLIETEIRPDRPLRTLDAGCGTGGMLAPLRRYGPVIGLDLAPEAASIWRKRRLQHVLRGSITALPFPDATFDLITSFDVVYHLAVRDDLLAFAEFARVLRPGGWLLVRAPAFERLRGAHDQVVHTRHRYTTGELAHKLRQAGFIIRRSTYVNTLLFPIAAARRLWDQRRGLPAAAHARSDVSAVPAPVNALLGAALWLEAEALRVADLPFGLSAVCLARRYDAPATA